MDFINSFLVVTALAYYFVMFISKQFDINLQSKNIERVMFFIVGSLILVAMAINLVYLWAALAIFYVYVALRSYKGYQDWGSIWHNLYMCTWDLALAVIFLSKV